MNSITAPTLIALLVQLGLGGAVFQANPRRRSNQCFLLLSLTIGVWLGSLYVAFGATSAGVAELAIRQASVAGVAILTVFNLLRLSIRHREDTWRDLVRRSWPWLAALLLVFVLCQTDVFLRGVTLATDSSALPRPMYGPGAMLYSAYFTIATVTVVFLYGRDIKNTSGGEHAELSFILAGVAIAFGLVLLGYLVGANLGRGVLAWFAPFRTVLFTLVIAYGIATRRIMEVGVLLRRTIGYSVLTAYVLAVYAGVWWLIILAFRPVLPEFAQAVAHVSAAVVIAFAMAPAKGVSQKLADRLFLGTRRLDFRATVSKAAAILRSVTTLPELLERFAKTVVEAVDTERVCILLPTRDGFTQRYPFEATAACGPVVLAHTDVIIESVRTGQEPLAADELHRIRLTPQLQEVVRRMDADNIAIAIGIFSRDHLAGVMLLGPRLSGRIYGSDEQNALQVLCGQLAVAIENAELFTEVQNAKIYNETLLENLTTGVIAASGDGRVTVFNREAEQITGLAAASVLEQPIDRLPTDLRDTLRVTLATGERQENAEVQLAAGEREIIARVSSSVFHGEDGNRLGALVVLTDVTAVKRLEEQIRRSDRLASLGTLSAGMAHEIKNPLVSIKTFTQLLPERYHDSDFRETFSNLIGHEIDRIDSLVNQLLRFARPAKPLLKPMHVHEVLEKSLMLVGHRLYQKEIKLTRSWDAEVDTIRADADQLEQVFLNFFLNAMDAMQHGGELSVATEIRTIDNWVGNIGTMNGDDTHEALVITVRDNGEGIAEEHVGHVFDPFFTTKDYGTGLGLSVVHGIIQEHGGQIEVESELARGTAFFISLPLVRFSDTDVVAA
ncbi:MAG TPA: ATP-binding protein [Chthoniobacterales bacterium]|nr:ATP-binding protein [Chthoniobacterales bacterium]